MEENKAYYQNQGMQLHVLERAEGDNRKKKSTKTTTSNVRYWYATTIYIQAASLTATICLNRHLHTITSKTWKRPIRAMLLLARRTTHHLPSSLDPCLHLKKEEITHDRIASPRFILPETTEV